MTRRGREDVDPLKQKNAFNELHRLVSSAVFPGIGRTPCNPRVVVSHERAQSLGPTPRRWWSAVVRQDAEDRLETPRRLATRRLLDQLQRVGAVPLVPSSHCPVTPVDDAGLADNTKPDNSRHE